MHFLGTWYPWPSPNVVATISTFMAGSIAVGAWTTGDGRPGGTRGLSDRWLCTCAEMYKDSYTWLRIGVSPPLQLKVVVFPLSLSAKLDSLHTKQQRKVLAPVLLTWNIRRGVF